MTVPVPGPSGAHPSRTPTAQRVCGLPSSVLRHHHGRRLGVLVLAAALSATTVPAQAGSDTGTRSGSGPAAAAAASRVVVVTESASGRPTVTVHEEASPAAARAELAEQQRRPEVVSAELDVPVSASVAGVLDPLRPLQWNLRAVHAPSLWAVPQQRAVQVAVLDSGVDRTHPDLSGVVLPGADMIRGGTSGADPNGHGTHVAGVIAAKVGSGGVAGVAPNARILPITVLDADGQGYSSDVARGIVRAVDLGAEVVNLSLGSSTENAALTNAVQYAQSRGVLVVAAAGNNRQDGNASQYPAATPGVLAVASISESRVSAPSSSTGAHVAVAAPGEDVLSTIPGGFGWASGTSMASPHVAAAAAVLMSARADLTADQAREALVSTATDLEAPGRDDATGAGLVDPVAALASLGITARAAPGAAVTWPGLPRDLDADRLPDLLTVYSGSLVRYEGTGRYGFSSRRVVGSGWGGMDLVVQAGDWDGDGRHDVIARNAANGGLYLYAGTGTGGFRSGRQIGSGWGGYAEIVAPTDWNGDGTTDLVARRTSDGALVLFAGNGRGGFLSSRVLQPALPGRDALAVVGDWDADGAVDLAYRTADGRLWLLPGDGVGGAHRPELIGSGWAGARFAGVGDWTGDRRPDLLSVGPDGGLRVYPSNGAGGFGQVRSIGAGWAPYRLAS